MPSLLWLPPPSSASLPDSSSDHSPASSSSPQQPEQCIYWRMKLNWIQLWLSINCYWIVDYNRLILKKCNFTVQSMEMHWLFWKRFIELLLRYLELMDTRIYLLAFKAKFTFCLFSMSSMFLMEVAEPGLSFFGFFAFSITTSIFIDPRGVFCSLYSFTLFSMMINVLVWVVTRNWGCVQSWSAWSETNNTWLQMIINWWKVFTAAPALHTAFLHDCGHRNNLYQVDMVHNFPWLSR